MAQASDVERQAAEKVAAMRECALQIQADILAPLQSDRNIIGVSSGSTDGVESDLFLGALRYPYPYRLQCSTTPKFRYVYTFSLNVLLLLSEYSSCSRASDSHDCTADKKYLY